MANDNNLQQALVVNNFDPDYLGRVQVRVINIHGASESDGIEDDSLPWASPCFIGASYGSGSFIVPEVGNWVYVLFTNGDQVKPVYLGGFYNTDVPQDTLKGDTDLPFWTQPKGSREVPLEYKSNKDKILYKSPKGSAVIISDNDEKESIEIKDNVGQFLRISTPLSSEATKDLLHRTPKTVDKYNFNLFDKLIIRSKIILQSITNSVISIYSYAKETVITIKANAHAGGSSSTIQAQSGVNANIRVDVGGDSFLIAKTSTEESIEGFSGPMVRVSVNGSEFSVYDSCIVCNVPLICKSDLHVRGTTNLCSTTQATNILANSVSSGGSPSGGNDPAGSSSGESSISVLSSEESNLYINCPIVVDGDANISGISFVSHTHGGVESGGSITGGPQ